MTEDEPSSFQESNGIHAALRLNKETGVHSLHVQGVEKIATVIKNVEPYIRIMNKKEQIAEFKERISEPRRHLAPSIKKARETLGLAQTES